MKGSGNSFGNDQRDSLIFPGIVPANAVDDLLYRVLNHGDHRAFQHLFRKMYQPLCCFCQRFVQVRQVAEELVSDVFFTIWRKRECLAVTAPKSYLYTAVRNRAFDYLRGVNRVSWCELQHAAHVPYEDHTVQDVLEHAELEMHMNRGIRTLPRQCKIIFEKSRDEGLKYREIAEELRISIKTVEAQMGRALRHLREVKDVMAKQ